MIRTFTLVSVLALPFAVRAEDNKPADFQFSAKDPVRKKALGEAVAKIIDVLNPLKGNTSIWFKDLDTEDTLALRPDRVVHPASTIKTPILVKNFQDIAAKKYALDQEFKITDTFASIVDGSPFKTDGGAEIQKAVGKPMKLRRILELMIHFSDNMATNNCTQIAGGPKETSAALKALGMKHTVVARYITDDKAFDKGISSTTSAADMGDLYEKIARRQAVSPEACDTMIEILLGQTFNEQIPAGLPKDAKVAHKTGWFKSVLHDCAYVEVGGRKYVLMILMTDLKSADPEDRDSRKVQAAVSKAVYETLIKPNGGQNVR